MIFKLLHRTLQIVQHKHSNNNNCKTVFLCEKQTNKSPYIIIFNTIKKTMKWKWNNKGNNKITELRAILQRESQNSYVYKQTKSVNNRKTENRNDPDLVQAFLKKWWVESDFKAPNLSLSLRLKVSGCHYNSIYNNTWTKPTVSWK
jgi:hypothetical protein